MSELTVTHIGGPTVLIEIDGWRILTDPTLDPPGSRYPFALGTSSVKTAAPALRQVDLGTIDAVLLSHDQHADNLDHRGRALLRTVPVVVTTRGARKRLDIATATGMSAWQEMTLNRPGKPPLVVRATPARHGPPLSRSIVGEVLGFGIRRPDSNSIAVWMSGDSVLYRGLYQVASRFTVDVALLHIGAVRFPITGSIRYTMDAREAGALIAAMNPKVALPVHYEGWSHFGEDPYDARARLLERVHPDQRVDWLPIGRPVLIDPDAPRRSEEKDRT